MSNETDNAECCPKFDPAPWDGIKFEWNKKLFIKDKVLTLFYMPINFSGVMKRLNKKVEKAGATIPDWICLSDHTSKWNMDVYLAVDKEVPGAENTSLTGKFLSRVYEGEFKETGTWCKNFKNYASNMGLNITKWYMWYTTCPKCAKKYGKNYVVIVAQVE